LDLQDRLTFGQVLAGLVLLGSLAIVAAWLVGSWSTYADALSHLLGHAIGGIIGAVVALLWRRRALLVLIAAGVATLGLHAALAWRATSETITPRAPHTLKIVSFNTWHHFDDLDRLQAYLERENADIVLVYEFGPNKLALIERLKRTYPYAAGCAETWHCAVEIFSKQPFTTAKAGRRELFDGPPRVVATFSEGTSRLTIVGAHVMRPIDGPNGHREEIRRIAAIAKAAPGPVIVAGDFNATWWSSSFKIFGEESGLTHMGRFLPSWPSEARGLPQLNIDHLWVSKDLTIEEVHLGPDVGSDHRPLIAIIRMPTGFVW
jgi:endonuclease/exonuclease/phosphatase (EEP) superfamily protein YafD